MKERGRINLPQTGLIRVEKEKGAQEAAQRVVIGANQLSARGETERRREDFGKKGTWWTLLRNDPDSPVAVEKLEGKTKKMLSGS